MEEGNMNERGSGAGMFLLGMLTGAIAGGLTALLLAPRTGKETREMIRGRAMEMQQMMQDRYSDVKERVGRAGECLRTGTKTDMPASGNGQ
jgi:gas vesicle protein